MNVSIHIQVPFSLEGPYGVLQHIQNLILSKGSAVVCVAEGAGQVSMVEFLLKSSFKHRNGKSNVCET